MTNQLIDELHQATDRILEPLAGVLGQTKTETAKGVETGLSTVLTAAKTKASTAAGATSLFASLDDYDGQFIEQLPTVLGSGDPTTLLSRGSAARDVLLGKDSASTIDKLADQTGWSSGSTHQLLTILSPVVLSVLGQRRREENIGSADGIAELIVSQEGEANPIPTERPLPADAIEQRRPANDVHHSRLADQNVNVDSRPEDVGSEDVGSSLEPTGPLGGELVAVLVPLVLLAALCWLGYYSLGPGNNRGGGETMNPPAVEAESAPNESPDSTAPTITD